MRLLLVVLFATATSAFSFSPSLLPQGKVSGKTSACSALHPLGRFTLRSGPALELRMYGGGAKSKRGRAERKSESNQNTDIAPIKARRPIEGPLADDPCMPMVEDIIKAMDERKAEGIWAVRVSHLTYSTSFFVNCEGTSRPMLQAIAGSIEDVCLEKHNRDIKWQGDPNSGWILLDYGEIIVNIMTHEAREFYKHEVMWENGEKVPLDGLVMPNSGSGGDEYMKEDDWGSTDPFAEWDTIDDKFVDSLKDSDLDINDFDVPDTDDQDRKKKSRFKDIL